MTIALALVLGGMLGVLGLLFALPPLAWLWCRWADRWPIDADTLRAIADVTETAEEGATDGE